MGGVTGVKESELESAQQPAISDLLLLLAPNSERGQYSHNPGTQLRGDGFVLLVSELCSP